jgi:hypothetical protein
MFTVRMEMSCCKAFASLGQNDTSLHPTTLKLSVVITVVEPSPNGLVLNGKTGLSKFFTVGDKYRILKN